MECPMLQNSSEYWAQTSICSLQTFVCFSVLKLAFLELLLYFLQGNWVFYGVCIFDHTGGCYYSHFTDGECEAGNSKCAGSPHTQCVGSMASGAPIQSQSLLPEFSSLSTLSGIAKTGIQTLHHIGPLLPWVQILYFYNYLLGWY